MSAQRTIVMFLVGTVFTFSSGEYLNAEVTADLSDDGLLLVLGDPGRNDISMVGGSPPSYLWVRGDGVDFFFPLADVTDILVLTGKGRDGVWMAPQSDPDDFVIAGDILIDTGADSDSINSLGVQARSITIRTGRGDDHIGPSVFGAGDLLIETGSGNDILATSRFHWDGDVSLLAGAGQDYVDTGVFGFEVTGSAYVSMGNANDFLQIKGNVAGDALLEGGQGKDDYLDATRLNVAGDLEITGFEAIEQ